MEEHKLQWSSKYWTANSLAEKINAFHNFLEIEGNVKIEKQHSYTKFEITGNHFTILLLFFDDLEVLPIGFDPNVFKLVFIPKDTPDKILENINKQVRTLAFLFENDINYLVTGLQIEEVAFYKVFYHFIKGNDLKSVSYGRDDIHEFYQSFLNRKITLADFEFEKTLKKITIENHPRNNIRHPRTLQLLSEIRENNTTNIILHGKSASGKTTLTLSIMDELVPDYKCYFIESTILDDESIVGIAVDLIKHIGESETPTLLIVDDLQSNLDGAKKLITFITHLQLKIFTKKTISFIGILWDDFIDEIKSYFNKGPIEVSVSASDLTSKLIARSNRRLTIKEKKALEEYAENNLFVLALAIEYINTYEKKIIPEILKSIPELVLSNLTSKVNEQNLQEKLKRLLFCISLFGQYEIDLTVNFLSNYTNCESTFIDYLLLKSVIRKRGNGVTLGHKSYSRIIFEFLQQDIEILDWYKTNKRLSSNADFILEFLKKLQPNQIYSILKKLYENSNSFNISNTIINTWQSLDKILGKILYQQKKDPTWNNTASSSLFAIQTLNNFGFRHEAEKSIDFFRKFYAINEKNNGVDIFLDNLSTVKDFAKIKESLINQDLIEALEGERGIELNEVEFHKNWLYGIILSAEGLHNSLPENRLLKLATYVENQAINGEYFYPRRISWCTSRVLIGLGFCKRSINNSQIVYAVANWLLNHPNYDNKNGYWLSGTGIWNHWFEATALAISALIGVGVSPEHPKIKKGISNLLYNKNLFIAENMELDGIFAIQTLSQAAVDLFEVQREIRVLSEWMTTKADWDSIRKTSDETFKQSCQISQSSAGITEVMWKMVREDLPTVVKAIDNKSSVFENITIFVSYEWNSQPFAIKLVEELYSKYGKKNVFFDLKDNNNISSSQFMEKINTVDITLYLCTKKYKEKADRRIGGVGSEAEQISKGLFEGRDRFIPILLEGAWKIEYMPNFWGSTIGLSCLDGILNKKEKKELHRLIKIKHIKSLNNG